jgi:hypothetical protein
MKKDKTAGRSAIKVLIAFYLAVFLCISLPFTIRAAALWQTLVDSASFNNVDNFQSFWSYNYPWGTDHNGSARMNATNVSISDGIVILTSSLANNYEGTSRASPHLKIRYNSGTFYLNQKITINQQYPIWDISGKFKVPAQKGTWPAFWMTGAKFWPPESDLMEFKGSIGCNQNTYDGSWQTHITTVSTASSSWHTYRLVACLVNSNMVDFHYYIDGVLKSEQTSATFADSPCWLIIDYQMEGSSGSPGPPFTTHTYLSNIVVKRLTATGVDSGPVANGTYKILSPNNGNVICVGNQDTANGSNLDLRPYTAEINQQWTATYLGNNEYSIIGRQSGRALQVMNSETNNDANLDITDYTNGNNQRWVLIPAAGKNYILMNVNSRKIIEASNNSTNKMTPIKQHSISFPIGIANQQWSFLSLPE